MLPLQDRGDNSKCGTLMIDAAKQISDKGTTFQELVAQKRSHGPSKERTI